MPLVGRWLPREGTTGLATSGKSLRFATLLTIYVLLSIPKILVVVPNTKWPSRTSRLGCRQSLSTILTVLERASVHILTRVGELSTTIPALSVRQVPYTEVSTPMKVTAMFATYSLVF